MFSILMNLEPVSLHQTFLILTKITVNNTSTVLTQINFCFNVPLNILIESLFKHPE